VRPRASILPFRWSSVISGRGVAQHVAESMEYLSQGWMDVNSSALYAETFQAETKPEAVQAQVSCPVCAYQVNAATAPKSVYKGVTYYFCQTSHKDKFDANPEKYAKHS
jgi:YHS domain-containing protein